MMTGSGKGLFNIFVASLLFTNEEGWANASAIMGIAMMVAGCIFLFLSVCKNMTDEEL